MFQRFQRVAVALFVAALAFYPLSSWAGGAAGKITHVQGQVEVRRVGDMGVRSARRWMDVFPDDMIETGADGRARILLSDSSVLTLSERSKLRIDEQVYDPAKGERKSLLNLLRGRVRAVVSKYLNASKSRFEIHTPTAVAGVRGTTLYFYYDPGTNQTNLYVEEGMVDLTSALTGKVVNVPQGMFVAAVAGEISDVKQVPPEIANQFTQSTEVDNTPGGSDDLPTDTYQESSDDAPPPEEVQQNDDATGGTASNEGEGEGEDEGEGEGEGDSSEGEGEQASDEGDSGESSEEGSADEDSGDEGSDQTASDEASGDEGGDQVASEDGGDQTAPDEGSNATETPGGEGEQVATNDPAASGGTGGDMDLGDLSGTQDTGLLPVDLTQVPPSALVKFVLTLP